ncbi:MAG: ABC transporter substrate-binding protein [Candidatus Methanomethylophilaceae archaeon]|nr:ABC transporter substrate-binding protein [Candidatus Methanomethylophilaceae archaeon]
MNSKQIAALAMVAIVVVGADLVLLIDGGEKAPSYGTSTNDTGRLTVFGNANNDDYIDQRDVEHVKAIIAGEAEARYFQCYEEYGGKLVSRSFADANCDNKIDQADVAWIEDMVDRKEDMMINYFDVDSVVSSCTYPLGTVAIGYKSNYEAMLICGAEDRCLYACNQVSDGGAYSQWYTAYSDAQGMGSRFNPDYEIFMKSGNEKPDFILSGTRAWFDANMEETCGPIGIDVVRLPFWEDNITVPGIITLGYLIGCEDAAYDYASTADSVLKTIQDAVKDIPESQRPLVYASYNGTKISTMHNGVNEVVTAAGGLTPVDLGYMPGTSIDAEGVKAMDPDFIVFSIYQGFLETYVDHDTTMKVMYDTASKTEGKYLDFVDMTRAYSEGNVIVFGQGTFMGPASYVTVAYLANAIYPDLFDFDVDALFADYIEKYHPEFDFEDFEGINYFGLQDVEEYYA